MNKSRQVLPSISGQIRINRPISSGKLRDRRRRIRQHHTPTHERHGSSPVEWCNRFVSFGLGYALSWSGVSSCWVGSGVSRDVVKMSRLR